MKNVTRSAIPASLAANATRWRDDLLQWIQEYPTEAVPDALVKHYAQDDVREALRKIYRDQCCYCEGRIKDVSHDHIEHRQPKVRFRDKIFDWDNLHLACPRCNIKKGSKWCETNPILDAVVDRPIDEHLTYKTGSAGVLRWPKSQRGATTVKHTGLNQGGWDGLPGTRAKIYLKTRDTITKLKKNLAAPEAREVRQELNEKSKGPYGTVIAFALKEAEL